MYGKNIPNFYPNLRYFGINYARKIEHLYVVCYAPSVRWRTPRALENENAVQ